MTRNGTNDNVHMNITKHTSGQFPSETVHYTLNPGHDEQCVCHRGHDHWTPNGHDFMIHRLMPWHQ